jgi:WD40 repeat protein
MEKWLQLNATSAYCLSYSSLANQDHIIMIGCNNGIVLRYSPKTLECISSLPVEIQPSHNNLFPACYSLCIITDSSTSSLEDKIYYIATIYSDKSLIIWKTDINNESDTIYRSFQYHRDTVCDLKYINNVSLPLGSFVTISCDNSIRFWNIEDEYINANNRNNLINTYKIPTATDDATNQDISNGSINVALIRQLQSYDQVNISNFPLSIHPNGYNLAFGGENGSIHILDIENMIIKETLNNHTNSVVSIDYTVCKSGVSTQVGLVSNEKILLASYDDKNNILFFTQESSLASSSSLYHIQSLDQLNDLNIDENKRNNNIIKFSANGTNFIISNNNENNTKIIFNKIDEYNNINVIKSIQFKNNSIFGMCIDSSNKFVMTTGKDKKINIWNISTGKLMRTYKNTLITNELRQCVLDPAGMFIATYSNSDNSTKEINKNVVIYIIDFFSGDLITTIEDISCDLTTISFSPDGRYLLVTDINGCIIVWNLPSILYIAITDRLNELNYIVHEKKNCVPKASESEDVIMKGNNNIDDIVKIDEILIEEKSNSVEIINKDQINNDGKIKANRWQKNKDLDIYSSNQVKSGNLNKFTLELTRNLSFTMESNDNVIIYNEDIIDDDNYNENEDKNLLDNIDDDEVVQFSNIQEIEPNPRNIVGSNGDLLLRKSIHNINSLDESAQNLENWLEQMIKNEGINEDDARIGSVVDDDNNDDDNINGNDDNNYNDDDNNYNNYNDYSKGTVVNNNEGKFLLPPKQGSNIRNVDPARVIENNNLIRNTSTSLPLQPNIVEVNNNGNSSNNQPFPPLPPAISDEIVYQKDVEVTKKNINSDDNDCIDKGNDNITNEHGSEGMALEDDCEESMNEISLPVILSNSIHINVNSNKDKLFNQIKNNIDDNVINSGNRDNYCNKSSTEELLQEKIKKCKNAFDELNKAKMFAINSYEELIIERDQISSSISQSFSNGNIFNNSNKEIDLKGIDKSMDEINLNSVSIQLNQDHVSDKLANVMTEAETTIESFKQGNMLDFEFYFNYKLFNISFLFRSSYL